MAKKKIFIDKDGNVLSLYSERFNKLADALGHKEIHRASTVEFNNSTNKWEVRAPDDCTPGKDCSNPEFWPLVAEGDTRDEALAKEVEIIETRYRERLANGSRQNS